MALARYTHYLLGWSCFALGGLGIFLPLLPTVPLWILAAWFFARSSPALRDRIYAHPRFGAQVRDFLEYGVMSRRAKVFAITGITLGFTLSAWLGAMPAWVIVLAIAILIPVEVWLLRRPESDPKRGQIPFCRSRSG